MSPRFGTLPINCQLVILNGWSVRSRNQAGEVTFSFERAGELDKVRRDYEKALKSAIGSNLEDPSLALRRSAEKLQHFAGTKTFLSHRVRNEFLKIETEADALNFFRTFGPFQTDAASHLQRRCKAQEFKFSELEQFRSWYDKSLEWSVLSGKTDSKSKTQLLEWAGGSRDLSKAEDRQRWLRDSRLGVHESPMMTLEIGHIKSAGSKGKEWAPFLQVLSVDVRRAIAASLFIDFAIARKGSICEKCGRPYIRDRVTRFCTQSCSDAQRAEKYRKRKSYRAEKT